MVKSEPVTTSHHPDVPLHSMFLMHVPQDMQGTVPACSQLCAGLRPVPLCAGSLSPGETTYPQTRAAFSASLVAATVVMVTLLHL